MSARTSWGFRAYEAIAITALSVACADPPRKLPPETAGTAGGSGKGTNGGTTANGGTGGANGGTSSAKGGKHSGTGAKGGSVGKGGSGGTGGTTTADGGTSGTSAGAGGESGASRGGEAGGSGEAGEGGASSGASAGMGGSGGELVYGGKSSLPVPTTTGVPKPAGTPGNLRVLNWAGFTGAVSFTFDDSLESQLTNYALLNSVGVHVTFYLVCANNGSNPGWQTAANDGHELGNHTMHHCNENGTGCSWGTFSNVDAELDDCTTHLESTFGLPGVYTMAAPMGDQAWDTPASERFVVNRGVYDNPNGVLPNDGTSPFDLPCHMAIENETALTGFDPVIDSVRTNHSWRIILNHSLGNNDGYHPVDPNEVVAGMTYAKDFGDVWVDTVVSIGAYWRAQKMLSTVHFTTSGSELVYSWTLPDHFPPNQYLRVMVDGGTVKQGGTELTWDDHGYYEILLDGGSVTIAP